MPKALNNACRYFVFMEKGVRSDTFGTFKSSLDNQGQSLPGYVMVGSRFAILSEAPCVETSRAAQACRVLWGLEGDPPGYSTRVYLSAFSRLEQTGLNQYKTTIMKLEQVRKQVAGYNFGGLR